ncbi:hypothetical protein NM688_g5816 [Phlebia brevispora]|uniref:Uncharacterized protein n=1 Tax=Phlebia brevispora TaxID=194682 RepID=A0ACC1SPV0_9APHY|nr:hypothetical protein NM688_g5816 [Phlebia brevispora]
MSATPTPTFSSVTPSPSATSSVDPNNPYGYTPSTSTSLIFVTLFSITTLLHLIQLVKYRLWWLIPTILLGGVGEIIGWSGRVWSSFNVDASDPYMMQIVCTIIAPTPFVAAIFITFGRLVRRLGERYSWLTPRSYSVIFLTCDIVSLVVQAAGGAIASGSNLTSTENLGGHIMLAGIVIQMIALFIFTALAIQFFVSFLGDRPIRKSYEAPEDSTLTLTNSRRWDGKLKMLSLALAFSTVVLMIRAVYRTIELADGWTGPVITHQIYFDVFDAAMVTSAMFAINFFHPGRLLFNRSDLAESEFSYADKYRTSSGAGSRA